VGISARDRTALSANWLGCAPWVVAAAGLAALIWFDLGPNLASNDDWMFAWSVKRLATGHGIQKVPDLAPLGLVQLFWGTLVSLGHVDYRLLRLSAVPFCLLAVYCTHRLSLNLGASRFWAAVAAGSLLAAPLYMALATTFMSEVFYIGLLMAVALAGETWVRRGRAAPICVALVALAFLERQTAVYMPAAITIALVLARRHRTVRTREWIYVAAMWAAVGGLFSVVELAGLDRATSGRALAILQNPPVDNVFRLAVYLPGMLGLFCAPFLGALLSRTRSQDAGVPLHGRGPRAGVVVRVTLICLAIGAAAALTVGRVPTLPGDYLTPGSLGPVHLDGPKAYLFSGWIFPGIEAVAVASFVGLVLGARGLGMRRDRPVGIEFLVLLAIGQLVPLLYGRAFDRYFLPALVVVLPLVALLATRWQATPAPAAAIWASFVMVSGLAIYVVGEQDYQAWQQARDTAARRAYAVVSPGQVSAGFEANGVYVELPDYDAHGLPSRPPILQPERLPSSIGPARPMIRLEFAPSDDPRPGVTYWSIASGRIVIVGDYHGG